MVKVVLSLFFIITSSIIYSQENDGGKQVKRTIKVLEYHENGQVKEKGKKKLQTKVSNTPGGRLNGLLTYFKQGKWTEYYSNGNKKSILIYDQGEVVKEAKSWNKDGTKKY